MPLQSGSDRVLRAMRRSYRSAKFLGILDRVRAVMPDAAITTDIIVGFPGETEDDFAETMRVVELARFASAYTFQYSVRPGTPAAVLPDQVPKAVVQERYERLAALQERISLEENAAQIGRTVEVLIAEESGRKDRASHRLSGRAADNRLVHLALPADLAIALANGAQSATADGDPRLAADIDPRLPRPGDLVTVAVTHAAPHHLVADSALTGGEFRVRRTRAGDAWAVRGRARSGGDDDAAVGQGQGPGPSHRATVPGAPIALGLPGLRR
jgi:tRNA-2-methylthio-N6-dimethylallyladenosine synthase